MLQKSYSNYIDIVCKERFNQECFSYIDDNSHINSITYCDLYQRINSLKSILYSCGIKAGNKICLISNNLFYSQITFIALSYLNICTILVDPKLPSKQIEKMLSSIDICLFLTDIDVYQKISAFIKCKALDITNDYNQLNDLTINHNKDGGLDEMAIIFSSGTTAISKPIVLSYDSIINSTKTTSLIVKKDNKYSLCLLPMCHISGIINLLAALYSGCVVQSIEHFNINDIVYIFKTHNPNSFTTAPFVVENMIRVLETDLKNNNSFLFKLYTFLYKVSLHLKRYLGFSCGLILKPFYRNIFGFRFKCLVCSSSQLTQTVVDHMRAYGISLINTYASTECGNPITYTFGDDVSDNTVGKVNSNPHVDLKLINIESGVGEICVKTNSLMKCYYNDSQLTKNSYTEDGYFITGDLGEIKDDYLYIRGRNKEVIKLKNGKKISPIDIENLLAPICPFGNTIYACGFSINNDEHDDIYCFLIDKKYTLSEKENIKNDLIKYNNEVLKSYPIKDVIFIDNFPYNSLGKIKRYELSKYIATKDKETNLSSGILNIVSKYINIDDNFDLNQNLNSLGIDSLSMYSIIIDIKEEYNKDILPYLSTNTTLKDLANIVDGNIEQKIKLRKIKSSEIEEMAWVAADCFCDYPLYKVFYPDDKSRRLLMFYNCWFVIYKRQNYSYITDDKSLYIAFKKPGDKAHSLLGLFFNPKFLFKFITEKNTISALKYLQSYGVFANKIKNKYFNSLKDNYIENMFVSKGKQGNGVVFAALSLLDDGNNIYAETHSKENALLFEKMGMHICEVSNWQNIKHYALYKASRH